MCNLFIGDALGKIGIYNLTSGNMVTQYSGHEGAITSLCLSKNGIYLLSSSKDKTSCLWNLTTEALEQTFNGHKDELSFCSFGHDDKTIITSSLDQQIMVWSIQDIVNR